jgi:transcriptional regulator with XRE-family HTH domain
MDDIIHERNLVEFTDPEDGSKNFRARPFDDVKSYRDLNNAVGAYFEDERKAQKLSRNTIGQMLGTPGHVYQRFEKGNTRFTVARAIHLIELLGGSPIGFLFAAAPHLFGKSEQEATVKKDLIEQILALDDETVKDLEKIVSRMAPTKA